ncbi:MAG: twin-arginine translocation signal domain-containing protein [Candidatus Altiarchaeota archaeon]
MGSVTRRRFLKDAAAAVTLAAAGALAPAPDVLAQQPPAAAEKQAVREYDVALTLGGTKASLHVIQKQGPKLVYFLPHYNEQPAPAATEAHVRTHGGIMVRLQHPTQERYIKFLGGSNGKTEYRVDPNRIFTENGIRDTTQYSRESVWVPTGRAATRDTVKAFSDSVLSSIKPGQWDAIVAVHNNTAGGYGFKSYATGSSAYLAEDTFEGDPANPDNFFFVTWRSDFEALKAMKKFNVVLQNNSAVAAGSRGDDGSLSVWAVQNGVKDAKGQVTPVRYVNVEVKDADKGKDIERYDRNLTIQQEMLQAAHTILTRQ